MGNEAMPLRVGAALPDPPFEFTTAAGPEGFDVALMRRIAEQLGHTWQLVRFTGADFNGIFAGLDDGAYDCVASGTTITPGRERIADFCAPYAVSGQSLVVDPSRHPNVHGIADLKGLVIGVQRGNTSQPIADRLVAEHRAARVRVYAYDEIEQALDDLSTGGCDAFMKLAPVTEWFVRDRHRLRVVETGITRERLGVCVRKGNIALREAIDNAQAALVQDGTLSTLIGQWLGTEAMAPPTRATVVPDRDTARGSSRFLKKAAQKLLLCWAMGCVSDNAHGPK
ncbi:ABC transporter substrate-binding protein [Acidocella sp.]|jgi:ABC-type amino acid transport substrate-binding protein|uniref:ABC transporter substrate-binding protein n=1 Tax=Acidocella sp. TaxID=50710 RepID=UPI002F3EAF76